MHSLHVRLVGRRIGFIDADEMMRALRHRYMMVHYTAFAAIGCIVLHGMSLMAASVDLIVTSFVLGLVALQLVVVAYLRLGAWLLDRTGLRVSIWLTPALIVGVIAMKSVMEVTQSILGAPTDWSDGWNLWVWIACFALTEVFAMVAFNSPLRRALSALRRATDVTADAAAAPPEESRELVMTEPGLALPGMLRAGTVRIPLGQVQRLEANGNYVLVVTAQGRHLVPGPFGDVAAEMPGQLGRRVHRSHWVGSGAARRLVKAGRDLWIETTGGSVVPVAASMHTQVQDWLAQRGIYMERGPRPNSAKRAT